MEDIVHLAIIGLLKYVGNSEERLLNAARQTLGHVEETETEKEHKIRRKNERKHADLERFGQMDVLTVLSWGLSMVYR